MRLYTRGSGYHWAPWHKAPASKGGTASSFGQDTTLRVKTTAACDSRGSLAHACGVTPRLSPEHEAPLSRGAQPLGSRPNETPSLSREARAFGLAPKHEAPLERGSSFRARALSSRSPPRSTRESSLPRPYRPFLRRTRVAAGAPIPHARADARERVNRSTGDLHIDGKTNLPVV